VTNKNPYLSIVIPAYNEADRLAPNISAIIKYVGKNYPSSEIIFVNDGSTDATAEVIKTAIKGVTCARLISYSPNKGKGYAIRQGVLSSSGEVVLFMDADLSTPLSEIPNILNLLTRHADIVIGSRGLVSDKVIKKPPIFRRFSSWVFDQIKYLLVGLRRFKDTQCGFKIFKGEVARRLFAKSKINRFMFDVEILYLAERDGLKIIEMPVTWSNMPGSKVRFFEGLINMFRDLWHIRYTHMHE